jgi:calcium/calmodulin-dependent protein kinase I
VNRETGQHVAVKTVSKSTLKTDIKKLYREVEIMSSLRHDNIIRLLEVFESQLEIHLIMDLVKGGELFDKIIQRGQYSEADAAVLVAQILSAVAYMHAHGVCHRDLKPENLLCAEDEELYIRIADFGLSKAYGGEDMVTICGTPDYVAPEVLDCKPYTEAVDMWSVGVITYTLLCGFTPFYGSSHRELFQKILALDYEFSMPDWGAISSDAKDFIARLLVLEKDRPTAAQALMHPWLTQNLKSRALPTLATAQKKLSSSRQHSRRPRLAMAAAASGGAAPSATSPPALPPPPLPSSAPTPDQPLQTKIKHKHKHKRHYKRDEAAAAAATSTASPAATASMTASSSSASSSSKPEGLPPPYVPIDPLKQGTTATTPREAKCGDSEYDGSSIGPPPPPPSS